jgi:hypothetical protein
MGQQSRITFWTGRTNKAAFGAHLSPELHPPVYEYKQDLTGLAFSAAQIPGGLGTAVWPTDVTNTSCETASHSYAPRRTPVPVSATPPPKPSTQSTLFKKGVRLQTRQLWEGIVTAVHEAEFSAILKDRTDPRNPNEKIVLNREDVSLEDRGLITPGSSFYWTIGTEDTPGGQRKNVSILQFRRFPSWTRSKIAEAERHGRQTREALRTEE